MITSGALVRVASRNRQHVLLKRPLQLLYPLEIHVAEGNQPPSGREQQLSEPEQTMPLDTPTLKKRPVRAAAERVNEKRRIWIQDQQD